ncbi:unnamed protein product [Periconia digitata]|uniref:Uncharacterized protein n=1 Tax=Periconia digitata TaxID=1303443 RepID=A0A9W4UM02_9PLEO|nr:unnamed protein product [Periconia digitata]
MNPMENIEEIMKTNVTSTTHNTTYSALSPTRPELSQANRVVLITGGGTGIGKSMAQHFALASASHVIIAGRRVDVLDAAVKELSEAATEAKSPTQFLRYKLDQSSKSDITALFEDLAAKSLAVDVLVLNAAKFADMTPLVELGTDELWGHMEANVRSAMYLTEFFMKQNPDKKKYLVNMTSAVIHSQTHPMVVNLAPYYISKSAAAVYIQAIANQTSREQLQVVTLHPGTVFGDGFERIGITEDMLPFDDVKLPGSYGVWAASDEAAFLHGRTVWAAWDVEELANGDVGKLIKSDPDYLQMSLVGLKLGNRAPGY